MSALDVSPERVRTLARAYRLYGIMKESPHLLAELRRGLRGKLAEKDFPDQSVFRREALERLKAMGVEPTDREVADFSNALMDLAFTSRFSEEEIDGFVNQARKQELKHKLSRLVSSEGASPDRIRSSLENYCMIAPVAVQDADSEIESLRVSLINRFISDQLRFIGVAKQVLLHT